MSDHKELVERWQIILENTSMHEVEVIKNIKDTIHAIEALEAEITRVTKERDELKLSLRNTRKYAQYLFANSDVFHVPVDCESAFHDLWKEVKL